MTALKHLCYRGVPVEALCVETTKIDGVYSERLDRGERCPRPEADWPRRARSGEQQGDAAQGQGADHRDPGDGERLVAIRARRKTATRGRPAAGWGSGPPGPPHRRHDTFGCTQFSRAARAPACRVRVAGEPPPAPPETANQVCVVREPAGRQVQDQHRREQVPWGQCCRER